ncbi:alpha/beta hydrolase [Bosea sp. NBC_00550]|uniref:alpha/beta hydrolase n=1 Tax=Bosea sp. NBC_00550 TaxID=2969621 RepID=UPI00222E385A|nr:alpha/beta hydrolase [Bosea sp. NBC_00550]UZF90592.1 alpha/beta hydrolase [Bosea sp. NBC_00550]
MPAIATQRLQPVLSVFWRDESLSVRGESVAGRLYVPADVPEDAGLVLHLHGGHFNSGSLAEGQAVATALTEAGAVVFSLSYPLAPGLRFPDTLEGIYVALEALARGRARWTARKAPVYVAGEEAGGNLAAALAMMARDRGGPALAGQILLSPMLDACLATASLREVQAGPVGCRWADGWADYLGTPERAAHPYAAPLQATRLTGLPPALLISAQDDPMRDEAAQYATRLHKAGVTVRHVELDATTHWPQAYAEAPKEGSCLCATRGAIAAFYALTAPP